MSKVFYQGYWYSFTGKTQKLKRAKEEAQAEIKNYKLECEKHFIVYQREVWEKKLPD